MLNALRCGLAVALSLLACQAMAADPWANADPERRDWFKLR